MLPIYIYIYIYIERERERGAKIYIGIYLKSFFLIQRVKMNLKKKV